jgi:hypothetical protein
MRIWALAVIACFAVAIAHAAFVVPSSPVSVKARPSGANLVSDQVEDGIDTQPAGILLQWDAPTTNIDNSSLPPSNLLGYDIEHTAPLEPPAVFRVGVVASHQLSNVFRGPHLFRIRVVATNGTSDWTNTILVTVI